MTSTERTVRENLAGDLWGGLASMLVALPASIAFGVLVYTAVGPEHAGEGALAGIIGAAALGIVAPLIGRNGGFISAPCAPAAAVMSAVAAQFAATGQLTTDRIMGLLALTALLSALLQLVYGALRAGRLIKFIPYQVVSGYLSGVALIIALGQLPKLLGLPGNVSLAQGLISPHLWNWVGITVGVVTIVVTVVVPRITTRIPALILGLLGGVAAYFMLALLDRELLQLSGNKLVIGPIEATGSLLDVAGSRAASLLSISPADVGLVFVSALTLSVLLSIDTLKTGVVLDAMARRRSESNRELIGQGAGNAVSFLLGGMPGAGTMGATLVNFSSGGRTPLSGVAEGVFVVIAFVALGGLIAWVPIGALAGVLLVVAWRMFDRGMFHLALHPSTRVDFAVIAVVVAVAQVGLIAASLVGILLAILLFIRDQIRGSVIISRRDLREMRSMRKRLVSETELLDANGHRAAVVQLQGNLFFGTTDQLFSELERDLATLRFLLLDLRRVQSMDFTAGHLVEQMKERLRERGGELLFSGMPSSLPTRQDMEHYLEELGLVGTGRGVRVRVFETRDSAVEWMENRILEDAGHDSEEEEVPLDLGEIELFSELDAATIDQLRPVVTARSVPKGEKVCAHGEVSDEVYLVRSGRVHALLPLEGGKHHHLATFCRGDFFGEIVFLDRGLRSANVVAATPSEIYVLSRERFDALARANPALGSRVFEMLAIALSTRLRAADRELRLLEER